MLIQGAEQGNRYFQGALIKENGMNEGWLSNEQRQLFKEKYEARPLSDAEGGDPQAMYAVADNCLGEASYGSEYRRMLAEKVARAGVGDAAYLCGEIYQLGCYEEEKNGEPDSYEYSEKIRYYLMGVESNNGAMLGVMQDCVADAYRDDDAGLPKDLNKAIYYYRLVAQNGYEMAEHSLQTIEEHPALFKADGAETYDGGKANVDRFEILETQKIGEIKWVDVIRDKQTGVIYLHSNFGG